jgi:4-amino-4-deoxy-L-arabinose transferase-like glycosyltransferase
MIATAILAVALGVRIAQVQNTSYTAPFDAGSYMSLASQIAHHGVYDPHGRGAGGTRGPSAYFPPAFPYFLAISDLVSGHTTKKGKAVEPARIEQAVLGTIIVAVIGLVASELFGAATGLIAMALAAGYPVFVELSAILVAESLLTAFMLGAIYAVLRARRSPTARHRHGWIVGAGVLTGLAALAHENGILFVIPLALAVWEARARWRPRGLAAPALLVATAALTIAPWTIRNAVQLHSFVPISDETGITLIGTYNSASASYRPVPYKWRFFAGIPGETKRLGNTHRFTESQLSGRLTSQALSYIADHPGAPFAAAFHNTIRMLELEGAFAWKASAKAQGVSASVAHTGVISFYVLTVLALLGTITVRARRTPRWIWAAGLLVWLSAVLVNMETPRFREPVEPFLVLLAACALATAAARVRAGGPLRRGAPVAAQRGPAVARGASEPVEVVERLP